MTSSERLKIFVFLFAVFLCSNARAACEVIDGTKRRPFDGSLSGLEIEKKSLTRLNNEFPNLNIIERTFKGELQTCSACTEKYIACTGP